MLVTRLELACRRRRVEAGNRPDDPEVWCKCAQSMQHIYIYISHDLFYWFKTPNAFIRSYLQEVHGLRTRTVFVIVYNSNHTLNVRIVGVWPLNHYAIIPKSLAYANTLLYLLFT